MAACGVSGADVPSGAAETVGPTATWLVGALGEASACVLGAGAESAAVVGAGSAGGVAGVAGAAGLVGVAAVAG
jgi:hypothetical protein